MIQNFQSLYINSFMYSLAFILNEFIYLQIESVRDNNREKCVVGWLCWLPLAGVSG